MPIKTNVNKEPTTKTQGESPEKSKQNRLNEEELEMIRESDKNDLKERIRSGEILGGSKLG